MEITKLMLCILALLIGLSCADTPQYKLDGTFMYVPFIPESSLAGFFSEINELQMKIVIIQNLRKATACGTYAWDLPSGSTINSYLTTLFNQANLYNISMYLGLTLTFNGCTNFYVSPNDVTTGSDFDTAVSTILGIVTDKRNLAGWYIPDEPAILQWDIPSLTYSFYSKVVQGIKKNSNLPILISPYLAKVNATMDINVIKQRVTDFQNNTGVTIQVWQDSVGAGAVNIYGRSGNSLSQIFAAISSVIGKANFWSDIEAFTYADPFNASGGYHSSAITRFTKQLADTSDYVDKRITWIQQIHFGTVDTNQMVEAPRMKAGYRAQFLGRQSDVEFITPISYSYSVQPSSTYPDTNTSELFNGITGDPTLFTDSQWVGIPAPATVDVIVQFSTPRVVTFVSVHMLGYSGAGITFPSTLSVSGSNSSTFTTSVTLSSGITLPVSQASSEYVFGNSAAFTNTVATSYLKISFPGTTGWTFLSEIEILGIPLASSPTPSPLGSTTSGSTTGTPTTSSTSGATSSSSTTTSQTSSTSGSTTTTTSSPTPTPSLSPSPSPSPSLSPSPSPTPSATPSPTPSHTSSSTMRALSLFVLSSLMILVQLCY